MDRNFDLRASLFSLSKRNLRMIEIARKHGARAKFAGSGGAAVGTYEDERMLGRLREAYGREGFELFLPCIWEREQ